MHFISWNYEGRQQVDILKEGDRGAAIAQLQVKLLSLNLYSSRVDGYFGSETKASLLDFQEKYGLTERGTFGLETWHALTCWTKADRFDLLDSLRSKLRELFIPDDLMVLMNDQSFNR